MFRPVDRHGNLLDERLSGEAVSLVIKERVAAVGLEAVWMGVIRAIKELLDQQPPSSDTPLH